MRWENSRLEREHRRQELEARREGEREARQAQLITTLTEAQPTVPQTITIQNTKLPEMKEANDMELFITMFEAALRSNNIPMDSGRTNCMPIFLLKQKLGFRQLSKTTTRCTIRSKKPCLGARL